MIYNNESKLNVIEFKPKENIRVEKEKEGNQYQ